MKESERRFEQELERLEKEPSYMSASLEKFSSKPTDIGAKYLWLKYTLLKQDFPEEEVPEDVMERMIDIIKYDIQLYEDQGRTPYGTLSKREIEKPVFMLLDLATNNSDKFWEILYAPDKNILLVSQFDEALLEKTRIAFPRKRKLKRDELYDFFGKQLGIKEGDLEERDSKSDSIGEKTRNRYRKTYKKNKKAEELLFK